MHKAEKREEEEHNEESLTAENGMTQFRQQNLQSGGELGREGAGEPRGQPV